MTTSVQNSATTGSRFQMSQTSAKPTLNLHKIAATMALFGLAALVIVVAVLPLARQDAPIAHVGISAGLAFLACMSGLLPIAFVSKAEPFIVAQTFILGMGLRLIATLSLALALVKLADYQVLAVAIAMAGVYFPMMAAEALSAASEFKRCYSAGTQSPASTEVVS